MKRSQLLTILIPFSTGQPILVADLISFNLFLCKYFYQELCENMFGGLSCFIYQTNLIDFEKSWTLTWVEPLFCHFALGFGHQCLGTALHLLRVIATFQEIAASVCFKR